MRLRCERCGDRAAGNVQGWLLMHETGRGRLQLVAALCPTCRLISAVREPVKVDSKAG